MAEGNTVAKNTLFLTIGSVAQKLLAFVYFTLLARHFLPPEDVGKYLYALSYVALFAVIVDFGMQPALIREIAKDKDRTSSIVSNALGIKIIFALATAGVMLVSARLSESDPVKIALISIAAITIILDSAQLTFYAVMRGFERLKYEAVGVLVGQAITVTTGALLLVFHQPLPYLMFSFVAGSLWNAAFSWLTAKRISGATFRFLFDKAIWREIFRLAIPFAIAAIFVRIYSSADTLLLNRMAGNEAAAFYGVPYKFVFAFQFIPIALAAALYPSFSHAISEDKKHTGHLFANAQRYLMLIVFPLIAGMIVLAKPIIVIFYRDQYLPSVPIMMLLAWCLIPAFLDYPVGALLNAGRRQNTQTALMGLTMLVGVTLNIVLIPLYGPMGSATAALIGNSVLFIGGLLFVSKIVEIPWKKLFASLLRIGISSIIMAAIVMFASKSLSLYISVAIGVLAYLGALFISREVGREEIVRLRDLILPPKPEATPTETEISV
jgi:O-antigen/teichoic acid export membrane protein